MFVLERRARGGASPEAALVTAMLGGVPDAALASRAERNQSEKKEVQACGSKRQIDREGERVRVSERRWKEAERERERRREKQHQTSPSEMFSTGQRPQAEAQLHKPVNYQNCEVLRVGIAYVRSSKLSLWNQRR